MHNEAIIIGNVGRDPEIRSTTSGKQVANFSVATSWGSGENKQTEWHRIVCWEKSAEIVQKYVKKGTLVFIQGQIRTRKWTDQAGVEKYSTEIVVGGFGTTIRTLKGGEADDTRTGPEADDNIPFDPPDDL